MPSNVEIKARVADPALVAARAEALADGPAVVLEQCDTFFRTARGRLKLRELGDGRAELIDYDRPDAPGPRTSVYRVLPVDDAGLLRSILGRHLPLRGVVRKRRRLFMAGQTRIHLDAVEGLGEFIELEVVLRPDQSPDEGCTVAEDLMARLGVGPSDLVAQAYVDLLEQAT
ncbi:MAG: class IV adenylate cyclase [Candidatus Krumholzibacteriia bacterium]